MLALLKMFQQGTEKTRELIIEELDAEYRLFHDLECKELSRRMKLMIFNRNIEIWVCKSCHTSTIGNKTCHKCSANKHLLDI